MPRTAFIILIQLWASNLSSIAAFQCTQYHRHPPQKLHAASNDDDFDPLLSPHAYPKGTGGQSVGTNSDDASEEDWSPMKIKSVQNDFRGSSDQEYGVEKSTFTRKWSEVSATSNSNTVSTDVAAADDQTGSKRTREEISNGEDNGPKEPELFDPLISPHAYAKGTSQGPIRPKSSMKKETVGVLLIDHGSKRATSNQRLETLRDIYADRSPDHYSVKAAHMEIAEPSIQQQIRVFCDEGVKKIVCHPYFLSPGRHVLEDIPELIEEAVNAMKEEGVEDLEVLTTDPVGSNLDLMVGLIGTIVDDTLGVVDEDQHDAGFVEKDEASLGGFFGEIQRMLDEQL